MKDVERVLGRLEEFKEAAERRFTSIDTGLLTLGDRIRKLEFFEVKVVFGATLVSLLVNLAINYFR